MYMCVYVSVCKRERERERESPRGGGGRMHKKMRRREGSVFVYLICGTDSFSEIIYDR